MMRLMCKEFMTLVRGTSQKQDNIIYCTTTTSYVSTEWSKVHNVHSLANNFTLLMVSGPLKGQVILIFIVRTE